MRQLARRLPRPGIHVLVLLAFLSLRLVLDRNMASRYLNEGDVLPLAKQYASPTWVAEDWYLSQPPGYRLLFAMLFGPLVSAWGFLAASITGRLLCYGLVAIGLVGLGHVLRLRLPVLLLAVSLFVDAPSQGMIASEWLIGGLEPKAVAYGFLLMAVWLMCQGYYRCMALMLGLATTFHVLVGGWAALAVGMWLGLRRRTPFSDCRYTGAVLLIYLLSSAFGVGAVLTHVLTPSPSGPLEPSYVYVFLRLPHHLNPLSWPVARWRKPCLYLGALGLSMLLLWRQRRSEPDATPCLAGIGLAEFTLLTLLPFTMGLAVAPLDTHGTLLQYYPFRLGDVLLPLHTCLLGACAVERCCPGKLRSALLLLCIVLVAWKCSAQAVRFWGQWQELQHFPSRQQDVDPEWKLLCAWIRQHTPQQAVIMSPPVEFVNFTWLTERPTIAKFKLFPQTKADIVAWHERLTDLSGSVDPWPAPQERGDNRAFIQNQLMAGYYRLTTTQVEHLLHKYHADYVVTRLEYPLALPVMYHNTRYVLYGRRE